MSKETREFWTRGLSQGLLIGLGIALLTLILNFWDEIQFRREFPITWLLLTLGVAFLIVGVGLGGFSNRKMRKLKDKSGSPEPERPTKQE